MAEESEKKGESGARWSWKGRQSQDHAGLHMSKHKQKLGRV